MPHLPGHYRDTFEAAIDAYRAWEDGEAEPTVEFEVQYQPREIAISEACKLVWNCTDMLSSTWWHVIEDTDLIDLARSRTYGAAARAMYQRIKEHTSEAV